MTSADDIRKLEIGEYEPIPYILHYKDYTVSLYRQTKGQFVLNVDKLEPISTTLSKVVKAGGWLVMMGSEKFYAVAKDGDTLEGETLEEFIDKGLDNNG